MQSSHGAAAVAPVFRSGVRDKYVSDKIYGFQAGCFAVMPAMIEDAPNYDNTASGFDHDLELARPDHYEVLLEDDNIMESHTANKNYGMFRFVFPDSCSSAGI